MTVFVEVWNVLLSRDSLCLVSACSKNKLSWYCHMMGSVSEGSIVICLLAGENVLCLVFDAVWGKIL